MSRLVVHMANGDPPQTFADDEEYAYGFHTDMGVLLITRVLMGGGLAIRVPHPFKAYAQGTWKTVEKE